MHYRITKVLHQAGKRQSIVDHLNTMEDKIKSIQGLQSLRLLEISETESYGISVYENEQQIKDAEEQVREIMSGMMSFMTGPPEKVSGGVFWSLEF
ncbi:MAG: hypothetical protein MK207_04270 [Saprospiraceae bacterium]|nr:hypothetical protein [Saprospiraceae bacterium]